MTSYSKRLLPTVRSRCLTALALLILPIGAFAQEDDEDEDIYEISPFVIQEGEESGYIATSTLAGTRLRSSLQDIGASVQNPHLCGFAAEKQIPISQETLRLCRKDSQSLIYAAVLHHPLLTGERARLACPHWRLADEPWRAATWLSRSSTAGTGEYGGGAKFNTRGRVCSPENAWPASNRELRGLVEPEFNRPL